MTRPWTLIWLGCLTAACGATPADPHSAPPPDGTPPSPVPAATEQAAAPVAPAAPTASPEAGAAAAANAAGPTKPQRTTPFPPPAYEAPHERTAKPTDGKWTPFPEGTAATEAVMFRSEVHPDPYKRYVFTTVVAIDRSRVELGMVAGIDEPKSETVTAEQRTGLIPAEHHDDLIAVFNGGFMFRHGKHGMMIDGLQFVPPREARCTIALDKDGGIRVRSWEALAGDLGAIRAYRQSSPCLVEQGTIHPELPSEHRNRRWGAAEGGKRDVRRSAVCLDKSGETLMYGYGDYITATQFAHGLRQAGGYDCAQLDINWSYTRFFLIDHSSKPPTLGYTFVEKLKFNKTSYVSKPYWKDFFYLRHRR